MLKSIESSNLPKKTVIKLGTLDLSKEESKLEEKPTDDGPTLI